MGKWNEWERVGEKWKNWGKIYKRWENNRDIGNYLEIVGEKCEKGMGEDWERVEEGTRKRWRRNG